jgi:hypothetical protein
MSDDIVVIKIIQKKDKKIKCSPKCELLIYKEFYYDEYDKEESDNIIVKRISKKGDFVKFKTFLKSLNHSILSFINKRISLMIKIEKSLIKGDYLKIHFNIDDTCFFIIVPNTSLKELDHENYILRTLVTFKIKGELNEYLEMKKQVKESFEKIFEYIVFEEENEHIEKICLFNPLQYILVNNMKLKLVDYLKEVSKQKTFNLSYLY